MVHFPKVVGRNRGSEEEQRISAVTAGFVNKILDNQLPSVMKTLSPRRINGFDSHNGFVVPRIEHIQDEKFDQYTVSTKNNEINITQNEEEEPSDVPSTTYKQFKLKSPEYICFINHSSSEIVEKSLTNLPRWRRRKRRAPPSRVKSMDELMLEESLRRNSRSLSRVPDLRVKGSFAPGYQCKWERFKHLPDIKPIADTFQRQAMSVDQSVYQDADASFSMGRVDEILKSEGFLTPDSGISPSTNNSPQLNHILLDDDFFKGRMMPTQYFNRHTKRTEDKMFSISASRIDPQIKLPRADRAAVNSGESLAILQARKRLPALVSQHSAKAKPD